jgi:hypothetical protein
MMFGILVLAASLLEGKDAPSVIHIVTGSSNYISLWQRGRPSASIANLLYNIAKV